MSDDCWEWERIRPIMEVKWIANDREFVVIVDTSFRDTAITNAWELSSPEERPISKEHMKTTARNLLT